MIEKYSLVELLKEGKFDYVQEIMPDGKLKLTGSTEPVENNSEFVREFFTDTSKTEKIIEVYLQLKLLKDIYATEIRRRSTEVQKLKTKSKYFHDDFTFKK